MTVSDEARIAVLASGTGSILHALLEAGLPVVVVGVDRPCPAIEIAESYGVPVEKVLRSDFSARFDRFAYSDALAKALAPYKVDLVAMAGFGTVLERPMHDAYPGRILNTHPSLLPNFKGWHAVADALKAGVSVTGCSVHVATLEVDEGPILAQKEVPVLPGDTEETLHERIKQVERRLYPETIRKFLRSLVQGVEIQAGVEERTKAGKEAGSTNPVLLVQDQERSRI